MFGGSYLQQHNVSCVVIRLGVVMQPQLLRMMYVVSRHAVYLCSLLASYMYRTTVVWLCFSASDQSIMFSGSVAQNIGLASATIISDSSSITVHCVCVCVGEQSLAYVEQIDATRL